MGAWTLGDELWPREGEGLSWTFITLETIEFAILAGGLNEPTRDGEAAELEAGQLRHSQSWHWKGNSLHETGMHGS